jgi:hypothetical protein
LGAVSEIRRCPTALGPKSSTAREPGTRGSELPAAVSLGQNKSAVYDLLFRTSSETLLTIAPTGQARGLKAHDPKHLGARIGIHRRASHLGLGDDPSSACASDRAGRRNIARWYALDALQTRRPLPVRVLSRLFRRLFLTRLADAHAAGRLVFFGELDRLRNRTAFATYLSPLRKKKCRVGEDVATLSPQSGRIEARTGLRMMPTSPRSPLSFRTAGFPQYGWKDGVSDGAFPTRRSVQACSRHTLTTYWFASVLRASRRIHECPAQCRVG